MQIAKREDAKKKPSRQDLVVRVRGAAREARVPLPLRLRRKPDVYADGRASKSDKASPTTSPGFPGVFVAASCAFCRG